jgi:hypothetical protein
MNCQSIKKLFEKIIEQKKIFARNFLQADVAELLNIRPLIDREIDVVRAELDPDRLKERETLARQFKFDYVGKFSPDGIARAKKYDEWFYVDKAGQRTDPENDFLAARSFVNGMAIGLRSLGNGKLFFLIGKNGRHIAIHAAYWLGDFHDGFAWVREKEVTNASNSFNYYINEDGKDAFELSLTPYEDAGDFSCGYAPVKQDGMWHYIDTKGKKAFGGKEFYDAKSFTEGKALVIHNIKEDYNPYSMGVESTLNCMNYIDTEGNYIFSTDYPEFNEASQFENSLAWVLKQEYNAQKNIEYSWRLIDESGKVKFKTEKYRDLESFSCGIALFYRESYYFYVNVNGKEITDMRYESYEDFHEDRALVMKNGKYYFIDKDGNEINQTGFDEAKQFNEGTAEVKIGDDAFYIDKRGRRVFSVAAK